MARKMVMLDTLSVILAIMTAKVETVQMEPSTFRSERLKLLKEIGDYISGDPWRTPRWKPSDN